MLCANYSGRQSINVLALVLYAPFIIPSLGAYYIDDDSTGLPASLNSSALLPVQNGVATNVTDVFDRASSVSMAAAIFQRPLDEATSSPETSQEDFGRQQRRLLQESSPRSVEPTRRSESVAGNFSNGRDDVVAADDTTSAANKTIGKRKYDGLPRRWFHLVNGAQVNCSFIEYTYTLVLRPIW